MDAFLPSSSLCSLILFPLFATGVIDNKSENGGKFGTGVVDTGGAPWLANIFANFRKKFETVLMGYSGAEGKLIHEKNQRQKISWHCPFKQQTLLKNERGIKAGRGVVEGWDKRVWRTEKFLTKFTELSVSLHLSGKNKEQNIIKTIFSIHVY
jgi:hypothetical protein